MRCFALVECILAFLLMLFAQAIGSLPFLAGNSKFLYIPAAALQMLVLFLFVRVFRTTLLAADKKDVRLRRPQQPATWAAAALLLPGLVICFYLLAVPGVFVPGAAKPLHVAGQLCYAVFGMGVIAAVTEEIIFRGLILYVLENAWNRTVAVLVPSVLLGVLRLASLPAFVATDVVLLFAAGTLSSVLFSLVAIAANSVWASALVHGVWNMAIAGGLLDIATQPRASALLGYRLHTGQPLLTGGAYGIDTALPAVVAYALFSVFAFRMQSRQPKPGHVPKA